MATYYARKSGNVNAVDVWATTPSGTAGDYFSSFTNADVLVANSFTVTVNVNTTVASVLNDTTGGATGGGTFAMSVNGVTLTANVTGGTTTTACVTATAVVAIVGAIAGGPGTGNNGGLAVNCTNGSLTVTGSVAGGTGGASYGIQSATFGSVSVTGSVTGGSVFGMHIYTGVPIVTVTGPVTGGNSTSAYGINYTVAGSVTVTGTATGAAGPAVFHNSTGTVAVTRAKGGPTASSAVGVVGSTTGSTSVEEIEFGDLGASPTSGPIRLTDKTSNVAVMYRFGTTKKTLTDPNATGLMPAASNVRSGVVYNGGNNTGTCIIPPASSVVSGAPVDATTGTAALTPASLWDYLTSAATTSGSMGERLSNCATVASVGQSLANALTP